MRARIWTAALAAMAIVACWRQGETATGAEAKRPNILLAIADDWGWPHAGAYGDRSAPTPTFDRLAREGALFHHAYVSSPSCTPSRGALLTGQWHWRLEGAANLWSVFPDKFVTYPERLEQSGYFIGAAGKDWGPGKTETPGRALAGRRFASFHDFLKARPKERPFCFWLGGVDPHRPYVAGSGQASGIDPAGVAVPACFPDAEAVRGDLADYYFEVQRFDRLVGEAVAALEASGELDDTLVVVTGDHGMPFPRGKGNLYDTGVRVPLAMRWPARIHPAQLDSLVSLTDLAPTFLEAAGAAPDEAMTGQSLWPLLEGERPASGDAPPGRRSILFGKERHVPAQQAPDMGGYPCRAIRTRQFLYIRNFRPDRWPAGTPDHQRAAIAGAWLADCDNGPTKSFLNDNRQVSDEMQRFWDLAFGKRPAEELYDLARDPQQLENVAASAKYAPIKKQLADELMAQLQASGDPRALGGGDQFDAFPYLGGAPKHPSLEE